MSDEKDGCMRKVSLEGAIYLGGYLALVGVGGIHFSQRIHHNQLGPEVPDLPEGVGYLGARGQDIEPGVHIHCEEGQLSWEGVRQEPEPRMDQDRGAIYFEIGYPPLPSGQAQEGLSTSNGEPHEPSCWALPEGGLPMEEDYALDRDVWIEEEFYLFFG